MVTYLLLILGMFFFGLSFIASKYALMLFDPITIILVRAVIASSLLASWLPGRVGRVSLSG
jgi:drug/metabolite transporter (DMT)-like permease